MQMSQFSQSEKREVQLSPGGLLTAHLVSYTVICCSLLGENKDLLLPLVPGCLETSHHPQLLSGPCTFVFEIFFLKKKNQDLWGDKQSCCRVPGRQSPAAEANMWLSCGDRAACLCLRPGPASPLNHSPPADL